MARKLWLDTAERALSTFVQAAVGTWAMLKITNIADVGWVAWLSIGAGAGVLSVVKGLAATWFGDPDSASLAPSVGNVKEVQVLPPVLPRDNVGNF